jgi:hypothetical protein
VDESPSLPTGAARLALMSRFTAAESAIYPLAMTDPDRYERAVVVIGLVLQRLRRDCSSIDALIEGLPTAAEQALGLATEQGISLAGLAPGVLGDAAAALRYRELASATSRP